MKSYFIEKNITISSKNLKPGFGRTALSITDRNYICSFLGPIKLRQAQTGKVILHDMLHFVSEQAAMTAREMETRRRLFILLAVQTLGEGFLSSQGSIFYGENLFSLGRTISDKKRAVFHVAFFTEPDSKEVPLVGTDMFDISQKQFALSVLRRYADELKSLDKKTKK